MGIFFTFAILAIIPAALLQVFTLDILEDHSSDQWNSLAGTPFRRLHHAVKTLFGGYELTNLSPAHTRLFRVTRVVNVVAYAVFLAAAVSIVLFGRSP